MTPTTMLWLTLLAFATWFVLRWHQAASRHDHAMAALDIEREQAHRTGRHARPGGRGDCIICGAHDPYDVERPGAL